MNVIVSSAKEKEASSAATMYVDQTEQALNAIQGIAMVEQYMISGTLVLDLIESGFMHRCRHSHTVSSSYSSGSGRIQHL